MKCGSLEAAPLQSAADEFRETILLVDLDLIENAETPRGWCDLSRADETSRGNIGRPTKRMSGSMGCTEHDVTALPAPARDQLTEELRTAEQLAQLLAPLLAAVARAVGARTAARSGGYGGSLTIRG